MFWLKKRYHAELDGVGIRLYELSQRIAVEVIKKNSNDAVILLKSWSVRDESPSFVTKGRVRFYFVEMEVSTPAGLNFLRIMFKAQTFLTGNGITDIPIAWVSLGEKKFEIEIFGNKITFLPEGTPAGK